MYSRIMLEVGDLEKTVFPYSLKMDGWRKAIGTFWKSEFLIARQKLSALPIQYV